MEKVKYRQIEDYMLQCMKDSAHDREHVYRVLHMALMIAGEENGVDLDVLICACLLHDIGRKEQFADPSVCHAQVGGEKAYQFLTGIGYDEAFAEHVRACIQTHRFRENNQPQSLEAKILFDADKLDAAGATGMARTLLYKGKVSEPLYSLLPGGQVSDGAGDREPSFFQEYKYKLEKLYDRFYTEKGRELAMQRRQAAVDFYNALLREVQAPRAAGKAVLDVLLREDM